MHCFNLLEGLTKPDRPFDHRAYVNTHNQWITMHITGQARKNGRCPFYRVKIIFIPGSPEEITNKTRWVKCTRLVYR